MAWCLFSSTPSSLRWPSTPRSRSPSDLRLRFPGNEGADPPPVIGISGAAAGDALLHQADAGDFQQQHRDQDGRQQQPGLMAGGIADYKAAPPHHALAEIVGMARPAPQA